MFKKQFVSDMKKVNATYRLISHGCTRKAYFQLGIIAKVHLLFSKKDVNKYKLSNGLGIEDLVSGNLVYHQTKRWYVEISLGSQYMQALMMQFEC
jgi:hypothetical protein